MKVESPCFIYNLAWFRTLQKPCRLYLHPVYSPNGTVLTDDFNPDHPIAGGISWMWADVVGQG